jgi:hypothetical protein
MSKFLQSHSKESLEQYMRYISPEKSFYPLDLFLKKRLKTFSDLSHTNRLQITESCYKLVRFKELLDFKHNNNSWNYETRGLENKSF